MPYPRSHPVTVAEMFKDRHRGHHTVCETLREIHESIEDEATREKVRLAFAMAKKMHNRLKYYRNTYEPERPDKEL